jgi:uracil-DNA glycosylase family 4
VTNGPTQPDEFGMLSARVASCRACPRLVAWRESVAAAPPPAFRADRYWARPLPGYGDPDAKLVLVGLAPAAHGGNRTGRMFTGDRSGDFLVAALWRNGFANQPTSTRADDGLELIGSYVTAPVRCAPPDNRPTPVERDRCLPFLAEELGLLAGARVYLALGAFAYDCLGRIEPLRAMLQKPRARFAHGAEVSFSTSEGRDGAILCSYHPSQRNVFTGLLTAQMFDDVLVRARELTSS